MVNTEDTYCGMGTAVDGQAVRIGVVGTDPAVRRILSAAAAGGMKTGMKDVFIPWDSYAGYSAGKNSDSFREECYLRFLSEVDGVYIASSGGMHYDCARAALGQGKHVLCRAPLALYKRQAQELFRIADEKGCVLMEDITAAYCPGFTELVHATHSGVIGAVRDVEADMSGHDTQIHAAEGEEYQGAFAQLGSHVLLPVLKLLGRDYKEVRFDSIRDEQGADIYTKASFVYQNGLATVKAGTGMSGDGQLMITGTKGCIAVKSPWWRLRSFEVRFDDPYENEPYLCGFTGDGICYVIEDFIEAVRSDSGQGRKVTAEESIAIAGIMETFLDKCEGTAPRSMGGY